MRRRQHASASDSDGTIAKVAYFNGTTQIASATTAPYSATWSGVSIGTYSLTVKAYDDKGGTASSGPVSVTVAANVPPSVSLTTPGTNAAFAAPAVIPLSASALDSDGAVAKVVFYNGTTVIGTVTTAPYNFTWSNVAVGNYTITAKATDDKGAVTPSAPVAVTVKTNVPPSIAISSPSANSSFVTPANVTLSVYAADSDGSIGQVAYYEGNNLIGTAVTAPYSLTWTNVPVGAHSVTAQATDDKGAATRSVAVAFTVKSNIAPTVSITSPANNMKFGAPAAITVSANATDSDGSVSKMEFLSNDVVIGTVTAAPYAISWTNVSQGGYVLKVRVTDNSGSISLSAPVAITVVANSPPAVSMTATPGDAAAPAVISLSATAGDVDGTIAKVEFYNGVALLGTANQSPYALNWSNVGPGHYHLTARATDDLGNSTESAPVSVSVTGSQAQLYFIYNDQINTARLITDQAGTAVWKSDAEPFGLNPPIENPSGQGAFTYNQRFPGQYYDRETGLHYNYHRDYDPNTGRYVQSDPIGLAGGYNTYLYAEAAPLAGTDPFGLFTFRDAAAFIPVIGSGLDAYDAFKCGNYGLGALNVGLAMVDATGVGALVKGLTVGTMRYSSRLAIREIYANSSNWNQMRRGLQDIGEVSRNSMGTPRREWATTDHIFYKQREGLPHATTNHPANLQTEVSQSLNSQFEHMGALERAWYLPGWMKTTGAGVLSYLAGLGIGSGAGCDCD